MNSVIDNDTIVKRYNDQFHFGDDADLNKEPKLPMVGMPSFSKKQIQNKGIWRRTEVLVGNGEIEVHKEPWRKSSFKPGCPFTKSENMVPIGGVDYMMEMLFGVKNTQFSIPTMYELHNIGAADSPLPNETYMTPNGPKNILYRYGHMVQLYGIGITGTGENDITVHPVEYNEYDINISRASKDGMELKGNMLPFRVTPEALTETDRKMYFGKKMDENMNTAYYLKRFETDAMVKHCWKTGEEADEDYMVSADEVWNNLNGINAMESFTEIILKINKRDVKEWFIKLDQKERTRINTIALFNGRFVVNDETGDFGDYQDVRLFSKLNIPVEYLVLTKDLNIIYRVYGA